MRAACFCFGIALLVPLAVLAAAGEAGSGDFSCLLVRGSADLRVDGSLSEWDSRIAAQPLKWSKRFSGELADGSTATVRCLADDRFVARDRCQRQLPPFRNDAFQPGVAKRLRRNVYFQPQRRPSDTHPHRPDTGVVGFVRADGH